MVIIPALSLAFLIGMYLFGFKTRYNAAITNTASIIEIKTRTKRGQVSSAIGVFNNKRGTMTIEYNEGKGIQIPFSIEIIIIMVVQKPRRMLF